MSAPRRLVLSLGLIAALVSLIVLGMVAVALFSPADKDDPSHPPDPLETVRGLLDLHGLAGRQPEERPADLREKPVEPAALARFVADLDGRDAFLTDLYAGFVVGTLARHQDRLFLERRGPRTVISAGNARVVLALTGEGWKVVLEESIPDEIRRRAAEEHRRFLAAPSP